MLAASLLIPAFNAAEYLADIVGDARSQNPPFKEIIIYDDASTDNTTEVARNLGVDQVLVGKINGGASHARNALISAASSPWLHFHDADDRLSASYTTTVASADPRPGEVLLCGVKSWHCETDTFDSPKDYMGLDHCSDASRLLDFEFQLGCGLYPADLVRSIGGFNSGLRGAEDHDFHVRLFLAGAKFRSIPDVLNTYCIRPAHGFSRTNQQQMHIDWLSVLKSYSKLMPASCQARIADLAMENASKLFLSGREDLAAEAVQLANALGRRQISSSHIMLRILSTVTGPWLILRARRFWNQFYSRD